MDEKLYFEAAMAQVDQALNVARRAFEQRDEARRQLEEARKIVWGLIEWWRDPKQVFEDLPRWLRKEIEK